MNHSENHKAREALFEALDDVRTVMLGADGGGAHMQPMAPQFDDDDGSSDIWFYTNASSDLGSAAVNPLDARICLMSKDEGVYACISGSLSTKKEVSKIEKFWSPIIAAWFEKGKEDPDLTMMCFTPHEAAVWVNEANALQFGFEIAKANLMKTTPDLGFHTIISF